MLLLPPDITRAHSAAGWLTEVLYNLLCDEAEVHVIPTLGQHVPHTPEENRRMFGAIPEERIHAHDWRGGCVPLGEIPADYVRQTTRGEADWPIPIHLNRSLDRGAVGPDHQRRARRAARGARVRQSQQELFHRPWRQGDDLRVAHRRRLLRHREQPGHAGHARPRLLQQGRRANSSAVCPTFTSRSSWPAATRVSWCTPASTWATTWRPIWRPRRQSREQNITVLDEPIQKIVCVMQGDEFFSTWVANKAIYRTRMALADGGELLVIAPGLKRFGEQPEVDALIRKYGYCGTPKVMEALSRRAAIAGPGPCGRPPDPRLVGRAVFE